MASACIERCVYPEHNGDESSIFCVSNQVAQNLATTFLRDHQPEPACRPTIITNLSETHLINHETQKIKTSRTYAMTGEDQDQLHLVLLPILKSIDDIAAAEDSSAKQASVTQIERSLADYFKHFKTL